MEANELFNKLDAHEGGKIPAELLSEIISVLPSLFELLSRKSLRKQVEMQGKIIQAQMQINDEQEQRIKAIESFLVIK